MYFPKCGHEQIDGNPGQVLMQLQLLGGNTGAGAPYGFHHWNFILTELGMLKHTHLIAVMAASLAWAATLLIKQLRQLTLHCVLSSTGESPVYKYLHAIDITDSVCLALYGGAGGRSCLTQSITTMRTVASVLLLPENSTSHP